MPKAEFIGYVRCHLCGSDKARVSLSKRSLCCVTCHACQAQTFARSDHSDMHIRRQLRPVELNTTLQPGAQVPAVVTPAPVADPQPAPVKAGWDIFA